MSYCKKLSQFMDISPEVKSFGFANYSHPYSYKGLHITDHDLLFSIRDAGIWRVNGRKYELHRGLCLLLSPGDFLDFDLHNNDTASYYYIHFDPVYGKNKNNDYFACLSKSYSLGDKTTFFERQCRIMVELFKTGTPWSKLAVRGFTIEIIAYLIQLSETNGETLRTRAPHSHSCEAIERSIIFIENNFRKNLSLKDMADSIGVSPIYFGRLFKKTTGVTPFQYLMDIRIEAAKHLLKSSTYSIQEIAIFTGFSSIHYFSRCFKIAEKIAPKLFREQGGV